MSALRDAHVAGAWLVVVGNAAAGLWALAAHRFPRLRHNALWWFTAAVEVAVAVEVALGVAALDGRDAAPYQLHMFYGFVALATIGIVYSYRSQLRHRLFLLYGAAGLFLMGLGIRAMLLSV